MALIRLGPEIVDIRGKFGSMHYKRDSSGLHLQPTRHFRPKHSAPKSSYCVKQPGKSTTYFGGLRGFWGLGGAWNFFGFPLTLAWLEYSILNPIRKPDGLYKRPGWLWFVHFGYFRAYHQLPPWDRPFSEYTWEAFGPEALADSRY